MLLCTILLLSHIHFVNAQPVDSLFSFITAVPGDIQAFTTDNLDNLYIVTSTGQLKKIDAKGDSVAVFNNVKKYGKLSSIDVTNPLKILLYYKDFATIVVLDRFLNLRHAIDLRKSGMFQVSAIGQSYDGQVWLFDALNNQLKKIDDEGNPIFETPDFRQLFNSALQPQYIFDQDGLVYLYDSAQGFFIFDYYGTLKKTLPLKSLENVGLSHRVIYGVQAEMVHQVDLVNDGSAAYAVPAHFKPYNHLRIQGERMFLLKEGSVRIYKMKKE